MATPRTVALGLAVGVLFATYLALWLRVPPYLALAAGASALVLILVLAAAFEEDAEVADEAWREAVADVPAGVAGRPPGEPSAYEPASWDQPAVPTEEVDAAADVPTDRADG
jgi:hypothetical protein